jgi:Na+/H+-dicarboxylate symporter
VFFFTGAVSAVYMLIVVKLFDPTKGINIKMEKPESSEEYNIWDQIVQTVTVPDFVDLFSRQHMLAMIIISILVGFAVQSLGEKGIVMKNFLSSGSEVMMFLTNKIMLLAPIGLLSYIAILIAQYGPLLLGSYLKAGAVYYLATIVYFIIGFSLYAFMAGKKTGVNVFWKNMLTPSLTSLGTCSSSATIPANLEATEKIGVSEDIRNTTIPLGAALHKDGSVMGGVLKIVFILGIFGKDIWSIKMILGVFAVSILIGLIMAGIPSGGMIGEMLILSIFGLPPEALPIIAVISTLIDPPATLLNATGDNVTSMLVSRLVEGKDWLKKKVSVN